MQAAVQKKAKETKYQPRAIIGDSMELISQHSQPLIRRSLMAPNIRNIRHHENLEPPNPKSLQELKFHLAVSFISDGPAIAMEKRNEESGCFWHESGYKPREWVPEPEEWVPEPIEWVSEPEEWVGLAREWVREPRECVDKAGDGRQQHTTTKRTAAVGEMDGQSAGGGRDE
uniref:Uncharacterized protein n=1 Tax=Ditylenchus dipsaci TaxID=166011 RepID=A0A915EDJ3_9BILA